MGRWMDGWIQGMSGVKIEQPACCRNSVNGRSLTFVPDHGEILEKEGTWLPGHLTSFCFVSVLSQVL